MITRRKAFELFAVNEHALADLLESQLLVCN